MRLLDGGIMKSPAQDPTGTRCSWYDSPVSDACGCTGTGCLKMVHRPPRLDAPAPADDSMHGTRMDTESIHTAPLLQSEPGGGTRRASRVAHQGSQGTGHPCGIPGLLIEADQGPVGGDPPDLPCGIPRDDGSSGPDASLV